MDYIFGKTLLKKWMNKLHLNKQSCLSTPPKECFTLIFSVCLYSRLSQHHGQGVLLDLGGPVEAHGVNPLQQLRLSVQETHQRWVITCTLMLKTQKSHTKYFTTNNKKYQYVKRGNVAVVQESIHRKHTAAEDDINTKERESFKTWRAEKPHLHRFQSFLERLQLCEFWRCFWVLSRLTYTFLLALWSTH